MIIQTGRSGAVGNCWTFQGCHIRVSSLGRWEDSRKGTDAYLRATNAPHTFLLPSLLLELVLVLECYYFDFSVQWTSLINQCLAQLSLVLGNFFYHFLSWLNNHLCAPLIQPLQEIPFHLPSLWAPCHYFCSPISTAVWTRASCLLGRTYCFLPSQCLHSSPFIPPSWPISHTSYC